MLAEGLVVACFILPVDVHVVKQVLLAKRRQDVRDVGVGAVLIAVLLIGAVAVIRPDKDVGIDFIRGNRTARFERHLP